MASNYKIETAVARAGDRMDEALAAIRNIAAAQKQTETNLSAAHRNKIARAEAAARKAAMYLNDVYDEVCR